MQYEGEPACHYHRYTFGDASVTALNGDEGFPSIISFR
jgi:hypothetical protein